MGIALIGFLVWAHHMFTAGMEEYLRVPFMYSTLLVAVPTGVKFFSWVATIWQGKHAASRRRCLFVLGGDHRLSAGRASPGLGWHRFHRPAPAGYLFHCRSLPRHHVWRVHLPVLRRDLFLVPQDHRAAG